MIIPESKDAVPQLERCIIVALCHGYSYADAAKELGKTEGYCAALVRWLKLRYQINNREQLGYWAARVGIV